MNQSTLSTISLLFLSSLLACGGILAVNSFSACAQAQKPLPAHLNLAQKSSIEAIPQEPIGVKKGSILLAYPRGENNNKIESASTFLVGAVPPGRTLSCNGQELSPNADGFFCQVVKLSFGKNTFKLVLSGQESDPLELTVERPAAPPLLAATSFNILPESIEPKEALGLSCGDTVQFAARATPGCQMSVQFGSRKIPMKPALSARRQGKSPTVNLGLDTAFGVSFQRTPAALKDLYLGFYKIAADDKFAKATPQFVLQQGKKIIKAKSKGSISVIQQPILLETIHKDTIVRVGPGAARLTPLPSGVRLIADGYKNDWWRLELCPQHHAWIAKEDLQRDQDSPALPQSKVNTVNMGTDSYGARIAIPLNQRLAFQIEQDQSSKKLLLKIFGATANTDFVTSDLRPSDSACAKLIDFLNFKQKGDLHYELSAHLNNKQVWGYWADYEDNTLVLHIKSAPAIDTRSGNLNGAIICVDPGHGGKEPGSIGCSGAKEANVNFAIADKLRKELETLGAKVIMTRNGDNFVSLQQRVEMAIDAKADMLISVHNNALPDGRDPLLEHGTSSYWYHQQSLEFARLAQKQLAQAVGFKDYGCRYQNLFLCRPTHMIAALMEIGFMINPDEFSKLVSPQSQEQAAKSIAASTKQFLYEKLKLENASKAETASP